MPKIIILINKILFFVKCKVAKNVLKKYYVKLQGDIAISRIFQFFWMLIFLSWFFTFYWWITHSSATGTSWPPFGTRGIIPDFLELLPILWSPWVPKQRQNQLSFTMNFFAFAKFLTILWFLFLMHDDMTWFFHNVLIWYVKQISLFLKGISCFRFHFLPWYYCQSRPHPLLDMVCKVTV